MTKKVTNEYFVQKDLRDMSNSPAQKMLRTINNSPVQQMLRTMNNSPVQQMLKAMNNSPTQKMLRDMSNSPVQKMLRDMSNSPVQKMLHEFNNSPIQQMLRDINNIPTQRQLNEILFSEQSNKLKIFNTKLEKFLPHISNLHNVLDSVSYLERDEYFSITNQINVLKSLTLNDLINNLPKDTLSSGKSSSQEASENYKNTSNKKNLNLACIVLFIFLFIGDFIKDISYEILINIIATEIQENFTSDQKDKLKIPATSIGEIKQNYRYIQEEFTSLKHKPKIRSSTIELLPRGTLIEVIDKSNRSWLQIKVEINGEIETGWILRQHSDYFK